MKKANWLAALVMACLVAFAGCGKKKDTVEAAPVANNAPIALSKLKQALAGNTNADIQGAVGKISADLRYGINYDQVLVELDTLNQNPALTAPEKKVVSDTLEQVKNYLAQQQQQPK